MNREVGVLIDTGVYVSYCLIPSRPSKLTYSLFDYLESNPELGLVTREIKENAERVVRRESKKVGLNSLKTMRTFSRVETFLKTEKVNMSDLRENRHRVKDVLREIVGKRDENLIRPWSSSPRFQGIATELYMEQVNREHGGDELKDKIFYKPIETEDKLIIADAVCLKKKYKNMFLASLDAHIASDVVSRTIRNEFGVECGYPNDVLPRIKPKVEECKTFILEKTYF